LQTTAASSPGDTTLLKAPRRKRQFRELGQPHGVVGEQPDGVFRAGREAQQGDRLRTRCGPRGPPREVAPSHAALTAGIYIKFVETLIINTDDTWLPPNRGIINR